MKALVYDTPIILEIIRDRGSNQKVESFVNPNGDAVYACIVSLAEVRSMARRLGWGKEKLIKMHQIFSSISLVEIENG
jgi:predicted nucleic acid-binding protein